MLGQKGIVLNVGDKVHYKNSSNIHPEAIYEGVVTEVHPTYYRVFGTPIRSTMYEKNTFFWGDAIPYYFCISRYTDWYERVGTVEELTNENLQILGKYIPSLLDEIKQLSA